jgi:hypothetical protein
VLPKFQLFCILRLWVSQLASAPGKKLEELEEAVAEARRDMRRLERRHDDQHHQVPIRRRGTLTWHHIQSIFDVASLFGFTIAAGVLPSMKPLMWFLVMHLIVMKMVFGKEAMVSMTLTFGVLAVIFRGLLRPVRRRYFDPISASAFDTIRDKVSLF